MSVFFKRMTNSPAVQNSINLNLSLQKCKCITSSCHIWNGYKYNLWWQREVENKYIAKCSKSLKGAAIYSFNSSNWVSFQPGNPTLNGCPEFPTLCLVFLLFSSLLPNPINTPVTQLYLSIIPMCSSKKLLLILFGQVKLISFLNHFNPLNQLYKHPLSILHPSVSLKLDVIYTYKSSMPLYIMKYICNFL